MSKFDKGRATRTQRIERPGERSRGVTRVLILKNKHIVGKLTHQSFSNVTLMMGFIDGAVYAQRGRPVGRRVRP